MQSGAGGIHPPSTRPGRAAVSRALETLELTTRDADVQIREELPQLEASIFGRERAPLRERGSYLGLYATVVQKGVVRTGDAVEVI